MSSQLSETIRIPQSTQITETSFANSVSNSLITRLGSAVYECPIIIVGKYKIRDWPLDVAVDRETGHRFVTVGGHNRVRIYSENGELIHEFGDMHLRIPCGVLIHQDSVYITDVSHHAIFQFRLPDLTKVKTAGRQGDNQKRFHVPKRIAISPDQYIYVADEVNHIIQILTPNLEFHNSLRHYTMAHPVDVKFSNNEIFVLSDQQIPSIHVFTLSGEKSRMIEMTQRLGFSKIWAP